MLLNTFSDDELRRLIDTEPENLAALKECARRFVHDHETIPRLEARITELEREVTNLEEELNEERFGA